MGKISVGYLKDSCAAFIAILLFCFVYGLNDLNTLKPFVLFGLACMIFADGIFSIRPSYHNMIIGHNIPTYVVLGCEKCEECIEKDKIQLKKKKDKIKKDRSNCCACGGSGTSYWSDDCYGSCLECCCINCGEFDDECECKYCKKCESSYMKNEEHKCY